MEPATGISADELRRLLSRAELFSSLIEEDLSFVASRVALRGVGAGEPVFRAGEPSRRFFIVRSGEVLVSRTMEDGTTQELARYVAGEVFGDFDFVTGSLCDADARAVSATVLVTFPGGGRTLDDLALENPGAVSHLLLHGLSMVAARLRTTNRIISENAPWIRELRRQVYADPPTGLWTKGYLDEELPRLVEAPAGVILLKPDRFKDLIEDRGHAAGDEAMTRIAAILALASSRLGRGWAIRVRSNETALVVPRCDEATAVATARSLAREVAAIDLGPGSSGTDFRFTASVALSFWPADGTRFGAVVDLGYQALLKAWRDGGNRIYRARNPGAAAGGTPADGESDASGLSPVGSAL